MAYKAIIFDLDGTIVDSSHLWKVAIETLLTTKNISLDPEEKERLLIEIDSLDLYNGCRVLKQTCHLHDEVPFLARELATLGNQAYENGIHFIDGFEEFHRGVETQNLKKCIATNADKTTIAVINRKLNLEKFFGSQIYNPTHVNNVGKPHPALYLYAAEQLLCTSSECCVIEDSAHGIAAAKAAGMFCIGINTSNKPDQLKQADLIVNGYHEIELHKLS
jgi:beta-phosphoglucomutase